MGHLRALIGIRKYNQGIPELYFLRILLDLEAWYSLQWFQEEDEDITMLAAPVTLQDGGVKERPQVEAPKHVVSQRQLRPIYKGSPKHRKLMMRQLMVMDEFDDILVPDEI